MSRWSAAHRIAQIAAHNARSAAGLAHHERIDIIAVMKASGVNVFGEPGRKLFGALIPGSGDVPDAIWLNSSSTVVGQRHSAGHEWGHYALGHTADCGILIAGSDEQDEEPERGTTADHDSSHARTLTESAAEAFAAWLLMPRAALLRALRAVGADTPPTARQCYQAALLLGTSYRGTARHLATAHLVTRPYAATLMKRPPKRIKAELDESGAPPPDVRADIWRLADLTRYSEIAVAHGDRIIADHSSPAVQALLDAGLAQPTHRNDDTIVLTAIAAADDHISADDAAVVVDTVDGPQRFTVHRVVRGLADTSAIPDLSAMTDEEIEALYAAQEAAHRNHRRSTP